MSRKDDAKRLKSIFKERFGYIPSTNVNSWWQYRKQNIIWIVDRTSPQGGYYKDNITGKKVTKAYEKRRKSEISTATKAYIDSQKPLSISQIKADHNVFKAKNDLRILKGRVGNSIKNVIGDEAAYDKEGNKLKGGKLYQQQIQAVSNQESKLKKLEQDASLVYSDNFTRTLKAFGVKERDFGSNYAEQEKELFIKDRARQKARGIENPLIDKVLARDPSKPPTKTQIKNAKEELNQLEIDNENKNQKAAKEESSRADVLKGELRALNTLNTGFRADRGGRLTLKIMQKEQQLHNELNPGKPFPKWTGRDALSVGYATGEEARKYARENRIY